MYTVGQLIFVTVNSSKFSLTGHMYMGMVIVSTTLMPKSVCFLVE